MFFRDVVGQEKAKALLRKYAAKQQIPHALLFTGNDGSGTLPLAVAFAQYINCETPTADGDSCGKCRSCLLFQEMQHPDFIPFYPTLTAASGTDLRAKEAFETQLLCSLLKSKHYLTEQDWNKALESQSSKQLLVSVDNVMRLLEKLSYKKVGNGYRIVVFWCPEKLNDDAANRMLKIIEEPPDQTLFIFVSSQPDLLLSTILSRLQQSYLPPVGEDEIVSALAKETDESEEALKRIAHAAQGSVIMAKELVNGKKSPYLPALQRLYRSAYKRDYMDLMAWSEEMSKLTREEQKEMLLYFAMMLREMFILHLQRDELCFLLGEELEFARNVSPFIDGTNVARFLFEYSSTYFQVVRNANMNIAYSDFAIQHAKLIRKQVKK